MISPIRPRQIHHAITLILGILTMAACRQGAREPSEGEAMAGKGRVNEITMTDEAIQHGGVRWAPAATREVRAALEVPGRLVANEDRTARVGAPAQGRVVTVHVQLGDRVGRGQPLVTLQSPEASMAQAEFDKATADLDAKRAASVYARSARERAERLLAVKAIARQEVERAQADDALARSELARAEAELSRAREALAQLGIGSAGGVMRIRSPIAGVVLTREVVPGAVVEAGAPLVTVSDPFTLWLDLALGAREASSLRPGSRLRFTVPAFPDDTIEGRVRTIGGALDPETRTITVRAVVVNRSGRLRAEMFATVWVETGGGKPVIAVPDDAVQLLDGESVVFVVHPMSDGVMFYRREVEAGGTTAGLTEIRRGLEPGELIVVSGAFAVKSEFARGKMPEMKM